MCEGIVPTWVINLLSGCCIFLSRNVWQVLKLTAPCQGFIGTFPVWKNLTGRFCFRWFPQRSFCISASRHHALYTGHSQNASTFLKKIFRSPRKPVFMRLSTFKKVPKIPILWTLFPENPRGFSNSEHRCFTAFLQTALSYILISKFFSTIFSRFTCRKYYTGFYILHLFRSLKSTKYR